MTSALSILLSLFSVLVPQKMWFTPAQPINITIKSDKDVSLVLTDFPGAVIAAAKPADIAPNATVDIKTVFPETGKPGTYVLYAVAKGAADAKTAPKTFLGTPVVIEAIKGGGETGDAPMVIHVVPLQYVKMSTTAGDMTMIFYYDVAPHTADSFLALSAQGFYDGISFHRIIPGFVIQGGDPLGTGTGGPGYHVDAEFNSHEHREGILSMARASEPNSAGSQFFICLNYAGTKSLDNKYTVFGKVVEGFDTTAKKIAGVHLDAEKPTTPQLIEKSEVFGVTADNNPYAATMTGNPAP